MFISVPISHSFSFLFFFKPFIFKAEKHSFAYHNLFIHYVAERYLGFIRKFAIKSNAPMNILMHVSIHICVSRTEIARS